MAPCRKCGRESAQGGLYCSFCGAPVPPEQPEGAPVDPYVGQTVRGAYFIQQRIGGGGMGVVYKAMHLDLDVPVAIKILKKELLADPSVVERFHREARAASRLRHDNVVRVTDFGETEDGALFMAMEYVAGKSLARLIAEEFPLSERRIVHIGSQVLSALEEAHASQVLHRDLKPENVMLESRRDEPDLVKVLDFGIAKIQWPGESALTRAGLVCGTPGYMSPEQWSGEALDARSDLYAVGVILYEMLTGRRPFEASTPMEMLRKHLTERPAAPSSLRPDRPMSIELELLVMRALSTSREERPASAAAMRQELLGCDLLPEPAAEPLAGPAKTVFLETPASLPRPPGRATPAAGAARPARPAPAAPRAPTPAPRAPTPAPRPGPAPGAGSSPWLAAPAPAGPARRTPEPTAGWTRFQEWVRGTAGDLTARARGHPRAFAGGAAGAVALALALGIALPRACGGAPPTSPAIASVTPTSGSTAGGALAVVRGTRLDSGAEVRFGGARARVVSSIATALEIATPAHEAGPVDVVVVNPDGRTATLPSGYTFVAPPAVSPAVSRLAPAAGPAWGGTEVVLEGSGFADGVAVSFGGAQGRVVASSPTQVRVTTPEHAAGRVDVVVTNPDGQRWSVAGGYGYWVAPPEGRGGARRR